MMDTFTFWAVLIVCAMCIGAVAGYNLAIKDLDRWTRGGGEP